MSEHMTDATRFIDSLESQLRVAMRDNPSARLTWADLLKVVVAARTEADSGWVGARVVIHPGHSRSGCHGLVMAEVQGQYSKLLVIQTDEGPECKAPTHMVTREEVWQAPPRMK